MRNREILDRSSATIDAERQIGDHFAVHVRTYRWSLQIQHRGVRSDGYRLGDRTYFQNGVNACHLRRLQSDGRAAQRFESIALELDGVRPRKQIRDYVNPILIGDSFRRYIRAGVGGGNLHVGHTAPLASVIVPVIVARLTCAAVGVVARTINAATKKNKLKNVALDMLPPRDLRIRFLALCIVAA